MIIRRTRECADAGGWSGGATDGDAVPGSGREADDTLLPGEDEERAPCYGQQCAGKCWNCTAISRTPADGYGDESSGRSYCRWGRRGHDRDRDRAGVDDDDATTASPPSLVLPSWS